jgi:hypothetical protein
MLIPGTRQLGLLGDVTRLARTAAMPRSEVARPTLTLGCARRLGAEMPVGRLGARDRGRGGRQEKAGARKKSVTDRPELPIRG